MARTRGEMAEMLRGGVTASEASSISGLFFASKPVTLLLGLKSIRLIASFVCALWVIAGIISLTLVIKPPLVVKGGACSLRFKKDLEFLAVVEAGLRDHGWVVASNHSRFQDFEIVLEPPPAREWTGVYFRTLAPQVNAKVDWDDFEIWYRSDGHTDFQRLDFVVEIGDFRDQSLWMYTHPDIIQREGHSIFSVSFERNLGKDLVSWSPAPIFFGTVMTFLLVAVLGHKRPEAAKLCFLATCVSSLAMPLLLMAISGQVNHVTLLRLFSSVFAVVLSITFLFESFISLGLLLYATVIGVTWLTELHSAMRAGLSLWAAFYMMVFVATTVIPYGSLILLAFVRRRMLRQMSAMIEEDARRYHQAFLQFAAQEMETLRSLKHRLAQASISLSGVEPRQIEGRNTFQHREQWKWGKASFNRVSTESDPPSNQVSELSFYRSGSFSHQQKPIRDPDHLYSAAQFAHLMVTKFAKAVALGSGGCFAASNPQGFVSWPQAFNDEETHGCIVWPKIKSKSRIVEKVLRTYKGDVSQVLDIARASILFQRVEDLQTCVGAILGHPGIEVVRVKDKLDLELSSSSAFRGVHINFTFKDSAACDLGIETHVCELQLVPVGVFMLKSDQGHKSYVKFRNLIGC